MKPHTFKMTHATAFSTLAALAALAVPAGAARAETSDVSAGGFTVTHAMAVEAEPQQVWQAFVRPQAWWSSQHTWSGQAGNLSLEPQAGGCWCERWGEGASVMHGRVLMVQPGAMLRLQAWLGPLQELPVDGVLTLATAKRDGATRLRVTYRVAGGGAAALDKLAPAVDAVLGEQVRRLKLLLETGKPE